MPLSEHSGIFSFNATMPNPTRLLTVLNRTQADLTMNSTLTVLLFGIARDLTGQSSVPMSLSKNANVGDLLGQLNERYPALTSIRSLLVAVNGEYAEANQLLNNNDEIALIPPVSGG